MLRDSLAFLCSREPISRRDYVRLGLALMLLKYLVDAGLYALVIGGLWHPLDYLNPIYAVRMAGAPAVELLPPWFALSLLIWGLGFAWLGCELSARRAVDAGGSGWWGLFFFLPFFNYALIGVLACLGTRERDVSSAEPAKYAEPAPSSLSQLVVHGIVFFGLMAILFGLIIHNGGNYGMVSFVAFPMVYGLGIGLLLSRRGPRRFGELGRHVFLCSLIACMGLLCFAMEGLVCIVMAFPIVFVSMLVGAALSQTLRRLGAVGSKTPLALIVALPISSWVEQRVAPLEPRQVSTSIEIAAPPEVVWQHVVQFSELPAPEGFLFKTGLAYPLRARIDGWGVGAVRHCEFSTGAFVEPITVWDEPNLLAFDVVEQPASMEEWSFYADLAPPHLHKTFRSVRGEFRLERTASGGTRLVGSTWYELHMSPHLYWSLWSDAILHRIHRRVLEHVKQLAEDTE